jgi:hypothetical protein
MVMVAFGMTAPDSSFTVPTMVPEGVCAKAPTPIAKDTKTSSNNADVNLDMCSPKTLVF